MLMYKERKKTNQFISRDSCWESKKKIWNSRLSLTYLMDRIEQRAMYVWFKQFCFHRQILSVLSIGQRREKLKAINPNGTEGYKRFMQHNLFIKWNLTDH